MSVAVRDCQPGDVHVLADELVATQALHVAAFPDVYRTIDAATARRFLEQQLAEPDAYIRVAEVSGTVAGYSFFDVRQTAESAFSKARRFLYLNQLSVVANVRCHGAGTALLTDVFQAADRLNIVRVELDVWGFNETARTFFDRRGFDVFGTKLVALR